MALFKIDVRGIEAELGRAQSEAMKEAKTQLRPQVENMVDDLAKQVQK